VSRNKVFDAMSGKYSIGQKIIPILRTVFLTLAFSWTAIVVRFVVNVNTTNINPYFASFRVPSNKLIDNFSRVAIWILEFILGKWLPRRIWYADFFAPFCVVWISNLVHERTTARPNVHRSVPITLNLLLHYVYFFNWIIAAGL